VKGLTDSSSCGLSLLAWKLNISEVIFVELALPARNVQPNDRVKPMPVWESILILVVISLLGILCFYGLRPYLEQMGWNEYTAYLASLSLVFLVMLVWSALAFFLEGNGRTWEAFLRRTRMDRFSPGVLAWSIGLGLLMFASTLIFSPLISRAISGGFLPIPQGIPDYINPVKQLSIAQVKAQLVAQGVVPLIPIVLLLNIFGEEIFWRGMVFPRQELKHGRPTFLIHGAIWAFSHLFQYWLMLPILISSVALAYVYQRTRNTWAGILAHMLNNALPFVIMFLVVS
jgi:membrane protease YdiL (CAAX protease family)